MTRARDAASNAYAATYVHPTGSGNNHIPAGGSADQVLTYASAGTAAWVAASGGGEQTFTASGSITAGQPVGINSNGTISTAVALKSGVNKPNYTGSTLTFQNISYDAAQDKFLMLAHRNNENLAIVGSVSGETFTFGTATTITNSNEPQSRQRIVYDPTSGKHLIIYERSGGQIIRAIVATISGTSVTFGTDVLTEGGQDGDKYLATTSVGNGKIMAIARSANNYANSSSQYYTHARIFTISGTSVTFGTMVSASGTKAPNNGAYGCCYDSNVDKVVVFYAHSNTLYARVGTVSGSSISFGSEIDTGYGSSANDILFPVFDPSTNKIVLAFADYDNSNLTKAIVGTVSGSSISFASNPTELGSLGNPRATYNSTNSTIVLSYSANLEVIKVVGTTVHRDRAFETSTVSSRPHIIYDDNNQSIIASDSQGECISVKTVSPKFAGLAKEDIANGATGKVTVTGGINTSQSGLISGFDYGLPSDSSTLVSGSTNKVGVALSATSILVTEGSI